MSWWDLWDEALLALIVLIVPGLLVLRSLHLRWPAAVAVAPAVSVAVLGVWPVLMNVISVPWNRLSAVLCTGVTWVMALVLARVLKLDAPRRPAESRALVAWGGLGVAVGAWFSAWPMKQGIGAPDSPPQTWDTIFHLNAVKWILEHEDGSSLRLGAVDSSDGVSGFYPGGWHVMAALTVDDSIVASANAVSVVVACIVWPLSLAFLGACLFRRYPVMAALMPVLGVGFVAFPARTLSFGALLPNTLGFSLIPVALAVTWLIAQNLLSRKVALPETAKWSTVLLLVVLGLGMAHPNSVFAYFALGAPLFVVVAAKIVIRVFRRRRRAGVLLVLALFAVLASALLVALSSETLRRVSSYPREALVTRSEAVVEALTDSMVATQGYGNPEQSWLLAILLAAGVASVVARWRSLSWLIASWLIAVGMYVLSVAPTSWAPLVIGPWYSDPVRLGALVVVASTPLAAAGVLGASCAIATLVNRGRVRSLGPSTVSSVLAASLLAGVVVASHGLRWDLRVHRLHDEYAHQDDRLWNRLLSSQELQMLENLSRELPPGAKIIGNPFNGSALAYAIGDVGVVYPSLTGDWNADAQYLAQNFRNIGSDPKVCQALDALGASYFYDDQFVYIDEYSTDGPFAGFRDVPLDPSMFKLVIEAGSTQIYEIDGCSAAR